MKARGKVPRQYNRYNCFIRFSCARLSHIAESWPPAWNQVLQTMEVWCSRKDLELSQGKIATDKFRKIKKRESAANWSAFVSPLTDSVLCKMTGAAEGFSILQESNPYVSWLTATHLIHKAISFHLIHKAIILYRSAKKSGIWISIISISRLNWFCSCWILIFGLLNAQVKYWGKTRYTKILDSKSLMVMMHQLLNFVVFKLDIVWSWQLGIFSLSTFLAQYHWALSRPSTSEREKLRTWNLGQIFNTQLNHRGYTVKHLLFAHFTVNVHDSSSSRPLTSEK